MKKFIPPLTATILATMISCSDTNSEENQPYTPDPVQVETVYDRELSSLVDTATAPDLSENVELFSRKLFKEIQATRPTENIMISPFSIATALSMTMNGSAEPTTTEMLDGLSLNGKTLKEANSYNSSLAHELTGNQHLIFNNANSIWVTERYTPLKRSFYEVVTDYYLADIFPLTGIEPVNKWINDKTSGKIPNMLNQLPGDVAMLLVNAVYFKGNWKTKFDPDLTSNGEFTTASGSKVSTDMMHMEDSISYKKGKDYTAVSLPYKDEETSLYVFLPDSGTTLDAFITGTFTAGSSGGYYKSGTNYKRFSQEEEWTIDIDETLFSHFEEMDVQLSLPKFRFESEDALKEPLKTLGMDSIFEESSNFTNFTAGKDPWVDDVLHKSFIEVNETGTEAAAATVVVVVDTAIPIMPIITIDRPFLFCIRNNTTKTILFMGQVTDPTQE